MQFQRIFPLPRDRSADEATGRFCTRCGAILDVQTAVAVQDEIEGLDDKFSTLLQDEEVQKLLMKKSGRTGHQVAQSIFLDAREFGS